MNFQITQLVNPTEFELDWEECVLSEEWFDHSTDPLFQQFMLVLFPWRWE